MSTLIVGGLVIVAVVAIIRKMVLDKKAGKGGCSCGGDCSRCGAACGSSTKIDSQH